MSNNSASPESTRSTPRTAGRIIGHTTESRLAIDILFASGNANKLSEIRGIFAQHMPTARVFAYTDCFDNPPDVDETGTSFEQNAVIKCQALDGRTLSPAKAVLAEDSGIVVDALDGRPGIYSARYGGEGLTAKEQCERLLSELAGINDRRARYYCAVAYQGLSGDMKVLHATVEGKIAMAYEGSNGFGYDPIFIPEGYEQSFGVLSPDTKKGLSHRSRAIEALIHELINEAT